MHRLRRADVFGAEAFPLAGGRYLLQDDVAPHTHDFIELAVVLAGDPLYSDSLGSDSLGSGSLRSGSPQSGSPQSGSLRSGSPSSGAFSSEPGADRRLPAGSVAVVRPGQWHGYAGAAGAEIANLFLGPELVQRELRWLLDLPDLGRFLLDGGVAVGRLDHAQLAGVRDAIIRLERRRGRRGSPASISALGLAYQILGLLAEIPLSPGAGSAVVTPAVRTMLAAMGDRPAEPWTMAELARLTGTSVSHLHREFRAQLGISPLAWLARTRGELAAALLIQTDLPVAEIGARVGWPDPNYFSRVFRRGYGSSPTSYRFLNR
ncbi:MAG TPA: helix-turn-helix transcriptional regulator [Microlunatus sp.]|nr:helix-turn-helix transcriptional regulator [Microlunatus sp.]